MEPTYQQITDILQKQAQKVVDKMNAMIFPVRSEYEFQEQYNYALEKHSYENTTYSAQISILSDTLNEITALKESLNTETKTHN